MLSGDGQLDIGKRRKNHVTRTKIAPDGKYLYYGHIDPANLNNAKNRYPRIDRRQDSGTIQLASFASDEAVLSAKVKTATSQEVSRGVEC
jgi:hypothetical protein